MRKGAFNFRKYNNCGSSHRGLKHAARGAIICGPHLILKFILLVRPPCHFLTSKALVDKGTPFSGQKYVDAILKLNGNFDHGFANFKTHRAAFQIFADPFSFDMQDVTFASNGTQIDLQCEIQVDEWKVDKLMQFVGELSPRYPELSRVFKRKCALHHVSYMCKKFFSTLNFNKPKYRSRLTNDHLQAILIY